MAVAAAVVEEDMKIQQGRVSSRSVQGLLPMVSYYHHPQFWRQPTSNGANTNNQIIQKQIATSLCLCEYYVAYANAKSRLLNYVEECSIEILGKRVAHPMETYI